MPLHNALPNPGSKEAIELGCTCPRLDNNNGLYPPRGTDWWIHEGCPVHSRDAYMKDGDDPIGK